MPKLKLQYFGRLMWRTDLFEDPDAGKDWRWKEKGMTENEIVGWHHQRDGCESQSWWRTRKPGMLQSVGSQRVGNDWETELIHWLTEAEKPWDWSGFSPQQGNMPWINFSYPWKTRLKLYLLLHQELWTREDYNKMKSHKRWGLKISGKFLFQMCLKEGK